jgi:hypothetical protein
MNRISRRSAAETAEALLEVGRTQPILKYDVELGLARHHQWLRSDAPMPEWASASLGSAAKSLVPIVVKTIVSAVLLGALAVAAWQSGDHPQPSAAGAKRSPVGAERTPGVAPSARDVTSEAWLAQTPIPVTDPGLASDPPARRNVRADVLDKRDATMPRLLRAHRELAPRRGANAAAIPRAKLEPPRSTGDGRASVSQDATPARVELAAPASTQSIQAASPERATGSGVAATPEPNPISSAHRARPDPAPQTQEPDDLIEMQQVATAEQLLERSPARALALVRQADQRFARGYFQQERAYIAIMALIRLGRIDEARTRAASFAQQFPALPYGARIRSALEAREIAAPSAASRGGAR